MNATHLSDAQLVKKYIAGSEDALAAILKRHQHKILAFIYSKINDREVAEDIFQDTFVKVIKTLKNGKYNEEGKFLPWVIRISHNLIIDYFRRNQRMPKFEAKDKDFDLLGMLSDDLPNAEYKMIQSQIEMDLVKLIQLLPEDQKEVLNMRLYKDMSFKEIADLTDVSINTALGRMRYALINLRKMVKQNNIILTD